MDLLTVWESSVLLRRIEFVTLLLTLGFPVISGSILLTLRHRIHWLQSQSSLNRGSFYEDRVEHLENDKAALTQELGKTHKELAVLRQINAPRQIAPLQADIILERLRGVHAAPVIVAAYAFEEESAAYARQIANVLRKANWEVTLNKASMNDFKGISLGKINLMHQPVAGLRELTQAFSEARMDVRPHEVPPDSIAGELQDGTLLVVVGRR